MITYSFSMTYEIVFVFILKNFNFKIKPTNYNEHMYLLSLSISDNNTVLAKKGQFLKIYVKTSSPLDHLTLLSFRFFLKKHCSNKLNDPMTDE